MEKKDFTFGNSKYYIDDEYVYETDEYIITIDEDIFDEETIEYANKIISLYICDKGQILNNILNRGLRDFYLKTLNISDDEMKIKLGRAIINIDYKKDDSHPNWKFQYAGSIEYLENKIDEHIISIEFVDDLKLAERVHIDG